MTDSPIESGTDADRIVVTDSATRDPETLTATFIEYLTVVARQRAGSKRDPQWVWDSHESLILHMVKTPTIVDRLTLPPGIRRGPVKECFYNAFMLTLDHPNLVYAEGFAMAGFFPVNHAWAVDRETGAIVDPTWVNLDYDGPFLYMGLSFSRSFMSKVLDQGDNVPAVFESDWRRQGKTVRCGLVYGKDGLIADWGDPPPF